MIRKLRIKFIVMAMVAVFVLLGIVIAGMNVVNYQTVVQEEKETLEFLGRNKGKFPGMKMDDAEEFKDQEAWPEEKDGEIPDDGRIEEFEEDEKRRFFENGMNPETPYESRFFSVLLNDDGTVQMTDVRRIASVTEETAEEYAQQVFSGEKDQGFIGDYLYLRVKDEDGVRITFLDCGRKLESARRFLLISLIASAVGYVLFFFVIFFYSKRITKPVAESYEKQKQFITDAGHEIKTPLAIIKADADVLEMDYEDNEWVKDIQHQTERLTSLTNDLVSLARMEEGKSAVTFSEFPLSETVEEECSAYLMLAQSGGKQILSEIQPALFLNGDEKAIRRLVNIFLDNAMKYSPENSEIKVSLKKTGKQIRFSVLNQTKEPVNRDNLDRMFDRFYRMDASRNSETGGHGIGLSMAKAITEAHGGKISASSEDGTSLLMEVVL